VLLFGGSIKKTPTAELWAWNGERWQRSTGHGPPALSGAAGVFDQRRGRLVIFGGRGTGGWHDDVWEWDDVRWIRASLPPDARSTARPVAAYDAKRAVSVVLLGREVWEWDGKTWEKKPGPPVSGRQLLWFPARERILLFGQDGRLWDYDGTAWNGASSPLPRKKLKFMWAIPIGRGAVLALIGPKPPRKRKSELETWLYTGGTWRLLEAGNPAMQQMAGMAWLPGREQTLVFGGQRRRRAGVTWLLSAQK
jgi:hypothetical protein